MIALLGDEGLKSGIKLPIDSYCNNEAALTFVRNPGVTARTCHYARWVLFARGAMLDNVIKPKYVNTKDQCADILTTALDKTTFTATPVGYRVATG